MVEWCQANLSAHDANFSFQHHNVFNAGLNPDGIGSVARLPADDSSVGLFIAWSVFTHVTQESASFYLKELARVLRPDGVAKTTWFLFDKQDFPMMQDFQNALYINDTDPTNAVIFDKVWLLDELSANGLYLRDARKPGAKGFNRNSTSVLRVKARRTQSFRSTTHRRFANRPRCSRTEPARPVPLPLDSAQRSDRLMGRDRSASEKISG